MIATFINLSFSPNGVNNTCLITSHHAYNTENIFAMSETIMVVIQPQNPAISGTLSSPTPLPALIHTPSGNNLQGTKGDAIQQDRLRLLQA
jgi:hypothetical protein